MSSKTTPVMSSGSHPDSSGSVSGTLTAPTPQLLSVVPSTPRIAARKPRTPGVRAASGTKETRGLRRADALIASGKVDKAIAHLRKLIADMPDSTRGNVRIASLLHETKQSSEALDILRNTVKRSPESAAAREALSEICLEVGRPAEAIDHSNALLRMAPRSLFARDVLSAAYLQCGKLNDSLRIIQEMIYLDPLDAAHHFKKGVLLQQKGQLHAAAQSFLRVLNMDPESEAADESRAALEMLDSCQIRQIITLAVEDIPFRLYMKRELESAVMSKGFLLSEGGFAALSQMRFDNLPEPPPGWRQYRYQ